ncbi:MAG TPA: 23S rRNA (guanosine(2251)-2'-O)-methyltransferase RlmB [Peptococcaceae bacterium]|nr:23S rRNA (guanosine(2251)-2'-O)-methyltransferase RlmB [Peptococcaceae bacterium]
MKEDVICGRNPVREALRAGRPVHKIIVAGKGNGALREIATLARARGVPVQFADRAALDRLTGGVRHQGVVALAAPVGYADPDGLVAGKERPLLVALAGVQDPRNLGAVVRTAEAAGADGVVIPARRAAGITPAAEKAAAGALAHLPVARVTNLARFLEQMKEKGLWVVGADPEAEQVYWDADLRGPLVLVVGGEEAGLGRVVRAACDLLVRVPMTGRVGSLNASVAAALLIYEVLRQRRQDG